MFLIFDMHHDHCRQNVRDPLYLSRFSLFLSWHFPLLYVNTVHRELESVYHGWSCRWLSAKWFLCVRDYCSREWLCSANHFVYLSFFLPFVSVSFICPEIWVELADRMVVAELSCIYVVSFFITDFSWLTYIVNAIWFVLGNLIWFITRLVYIVCLMSSLWIVVRANVSCLV